MCFFQFNNSILEYLHRTAYGLGLCEVYACDFQFFKRIIAAAGTKELKIICGITAFSDSAGDGNCAGEAGCILIYVERIIEVGDSCPLDIHNFVVLCTRVVKSVEFTVQSGKTLSGKGLTVLVHLVSLALKFSKQSLAEYGSAEALKEMIEDIRSALGIGFGLEEILGEEHFVYGRCNLCNENLIVAVDIFIVFC